jgi:hypothetical protein
MSVHVHMFLFVRMCHIGFRLIVCMKEMLFTTRIPNPQRCTVYTRDRQSYARWPLGALGRVLGAD